MLSKFINILKSYIGIAPKSFNVLVNVGATRYTISRIYNNALSWFAEDFENYEPELNKLLTAVFQLKEGAFIDIGANIGQTFLKVLAIDKQRQYIGFEPQPHGCFLVDDFIAKNNLGNCTVLPVALSDKAGVVRLGVNRSNDVAASFVEEYRPSGFYSQYKTIVTVTGDDMFRFLGIASFSLIKIDAEGAELEVLRGLSSTLISHKPYILFEILPHFLFHTGEELDTETSEIRDRRHDKIDSLLRGHGYSIFQVQEGAGVNEVAAIKAAKRDKYNYIAVPATETDAFCKEYMNCSVST